MTMMGEETRRMSTTATIGRLRRTGVFEAMAWSLPRAYRNLLAAVFICPGD